MGCPGTLERTASGIAGVGGWGLLSVDCGASECKWRKEAEFLKGQGQTEENMQLQRLLEGRTQSGSDREE